MVCTFRFILISYFYFIFFLSLLFQLNDNNHKGNKFKHLKKKSALINNKKKSKINHRGSENSRTFVQLLVFPCDVLETLQLHMHWLALNSNNVHNSTTNS